MPVKRCTINGKPGWKWGDAGICYPGAEEAKKKAIQQGVASLASEAKASGAKSREEINEYIASKSATEL